MEGIQILYSEPVYMATLLSTILVIGGSLLGFIFLMLSCMSFKYEYVLQKISIVCIIIVAFTALLMEVHAPLFSRESGKYKYKCMISNDVSMTEFYEKYSVIEHEEDIWTIKEK